jgi:hypothetical protein
MSLTSCPMITLRSQASSSMAERKLVFGFARLKFVTKWMNGVEEK